MRLFTFFFLLSTALSTVLPLPALAAEDAKKELSEEEEIALMMEQLEQFKASWEDKKKSPETPAGASAPVVAQKAAAGKKKVAVESVLPVPQKKLPPQKKIVTAVENTEPVQVTTQDAQITDKPAAEAAAAVPSAMMGQSAEVRPSSKSLGILKASLKEIDKKNNVVTVKPVMVPPSLKDKPENQRLGIRSAMPETDVKIVKLAAEEKKSIPQKTQTVLPAKAPASSAGPAESIKQKAEEQKVVSLPSSVTAVQPSSESGSAPVPVLAVKKSSVKLPPEINESAIQVEPKAKENLVAPEKKIAGTHVKPAAAQVDQELIKKLNVPVQTPEKEVSVEQKAKPVTAETLAAQPVEKKPSVSPEPASPAPAKELEQNAIVVVQDEAAQYHAARQRRESQPKSAREAVGLKPSLATGAQNNLRGDEVRVVEGDEAKVLGRSKGVSLPGDPRAQTRSKWVAARRGGPVKKEPPKPNLFADTFFLTPEQRLAYDVYDLDGFIFVKSPNPDLNTKYAVVTGFGGGAMRTRAIPDLQTLEDAKKWVSDHKKVEKFEEVEIKTLSLGKDSNAKNLYWVGQKAYPDFKTAQQEVAVVQSVVTAQGGDFTQLVADAAAYTPLTDGAKGAEIKGPANFEREEALMLKYLDQLDVGEKLFGPFQGDSSGESFSWQSFGETTWRRTNLDRTDYRAQVGFWTNRVVFKGFRFPMNTVDAFLEDTVSLDSTSADFSSNMKLFAGLEWRPFARNPWLYNYRPWGGISVLEWIKNFRFYLMYGERKAIKDPIEGSADTDLLAGVQIFYEWGVELPPLDQREPKSVSDFVEQYFWGEYFGDYRHEMTNFGAEDDYNSWLGNSSVTMGVKLPGIPLPENPINDELMLMPYMRFEHVNSAEFSFPYQNQYFVAAGMRWMPWRNYRYKENEWLSKAKFFGEYVGVGLSQHAKQDGEAPNAVRWDLRFGISFSSRRY